MCVRRRIFYREHPHLLILTDEVEPRPVDVDGVEAVLERYVIARNVVEDEVHPVHHVGKGKARSDTPETIVASMALSQRSKFELPISRPTLAGLA